MVIDPLAQQVIAFGGPGLGALWMVLKFRPWDPKDANGHSNLPPCPMAVPEASQLQIFKISERVSDILVPHMEKQTQVFEEIRDALRELKRS